MKTLIASVDSGIGAALAMQIPDADGTSRLGIEKRFHLDILDDFTMQTGVLYDRVIYTIAADKPRNAVEVFRVNAIRSFAFLDYCAQNLTTEDAQIVVLSSYLGSIEKVHNDQMPFYRMSKAALNMGVSLLNQRWPKRRWQCLHPGLVDTGMTEAHTYSHGKISPAKAASNIIAFMNLNLPFGFYETDGTTLPW